MWYLYVMMWYYMMMHMYGCHDFCLYSYDDFYDEELFYDELYNFVVMCMYYDDVSIWYLRLYVMMVIFINDLFTMWWMWWFDVWWC